VAALLELSAVIITEGIMPDPETLLRANEEGVTLLSTAKPTFYVAGELWAAGLRENKVYTGRLAGLKTYRAELHLHTVVSPCAEVEMIPPLIVAEALERGIQLLAVTDHNTGANAGRCKKRPPPPAWPFCPGWNYKPGKKFICCACLIAWNNWRPGSAWSMPGCRPGEQY